MEEDHFSVLCDIRRVLGDIHTASKTRHDIDQIVQVSASNCYVADYKDRYRIFLWSANALTLTLEDLGTISIEANSWTNVSFSTGMRIFAQGQTTLTPVLVRCSDIDQISSPSTTLQEEASGYVSLVAPPTQTSAGADTPLTFSSQVNHVILQNNTSANVYFAFDIAASLGSAILSPNTFLSYSKKIAVVHLYTAAAQNINGIVGNNIVVLGAL